VKAHYRTMNGRLTFEVEGDSEKALFKAIAQLQEIFECDDSCGCCNSPAIHFSVRTIDGNDYYGLLCASCGGELSLGQHKNNRTLFAKRLDEKGAARPNRGWKRYRSDRSAVRARPHGPNTEVRQ